MEKQKAPRAKGGLRKLASCVGEFKTVSILTSVFVAIEVLFEVFIPLIMAQIINVLKKDMAADRFEFVLDLGNLHQPLFVMND